MAAGVTLAPFVIKRVVSKAAIDASAITILARTFNFSCVLDLLRHYQRDEP
jgi:hypothetical protein